MLCTWYFPSVEQVAGDLRIPNDHEDSHFFGLIANQVVFAVLRPIPSNALAVAIVSAPSEMRGDECICRNNAGISAFLSNYPMSALGH